MGGQGTRLGLPFHKALAPTFTEQGIKPLYWHSVQQLLPVTSTIYFGGASSYDFSHDPYLNHVAVSGDTMEGTILSIATELVNNKRYPHSESTDAIVLLSDTIMLRREAVSDAFDWYKKRDRNITAVLMSPAEDDQLDGYRDSKFHTHRPGVRSPGWGALIGPLAWFANMDQRPMAHQLNDAGASIYAANNIIFDLGTPARYESYIGVRKSFNG